MKPAKAHESASTKNEEIKDAGTVLLWSRARGGAMPSTRLLSRLCFATIALSKTTSPNRHQFTVSSSFSSRSVPLASPVRPERPPLTFPRFSPPFLSSRRGVSSSPMDAQVDQIEVSYIGQQAAKEIDEILMGPLGFSVDQLMVSLFVVT